LRKLTAAINKSNTSVVFTNQLRSKIGIVYGNPETTTGGNALKFYAALRLDIRKRDHIKEGQEIVGNRVRVKVVKNKVAPPFKEVEFDIAYNEGISRIGDLLDVGVDHEVIQKSGTWFSYKSERLGQGREAAKKYFQENPAALKDMENEVRAKLGLSPSKNAGNGSAAAQEKPEKSKESKKQKE
jgi:recombination protein RecA